MTRLLLLILACLFVSPALAKNEGRRLNTLSKTAQELAARDTGRQAASELAVAQTWLGEARVFHKQEEEDLLTQTLQRLEVQLRLIGVILERAEAAAATQKAELEAQRVEAVASKTREEAFRVERELAALEVENKKEAAP
jgi:hypothetical protein